MACDSAKILGLIEYIEIDLKAIDFEQPIAVHVKE